MFDFLKISLKINFLVKGNINKNPAISVAKPGIIKSNAAKAIAAPINLLSRFFISVYLKYPRFEVFNPSYFA